LHQNTNTFGGRALPGPAEGAYSAPVDPIARLEEAMGQGDDREGKG